MIFLGVAWLTRTAGLLLRDWYQVSHLSVVFQGILSTRYISGEVQMSGYSMKSLFADAQLSNLKPETRACKTVRILL